LRDPLTLYRLPDTPDVVRLVPLTLQECDGGRFVVATSAPDGPPVGATVTHWNDEPIERVIEERAARIGAAGEDTRRARAVATLTHRPAGLLEAFDEPDTALLRYLDDAGDAHDQTIEWEEVSLPALDPGKLDSVDPIVDAVMRTRALPAFEHPWVVRIARFDPGTAEMVRGRLREEGVVLDLRANPGGDLHQVEQLLADLAGRTLPPLHYESGDGRGSRRASSPVLTAPVTPLTDGPVRTTLLIDALSGGAADVFAARFSDLELGQVLTTTRTLSGMGSLARTHELPPIRSDEESWASGPGSLDISLARPVRTGTERGSRIPGAEKRVRTLRDATANDADLLDAAIGLHRVDEELPQSSATA
jgi:hypothetical protein